MKVYRVVFPDVPVAPEVVSLEPFSNGRVCVKWEGKDHTGHTEEWEVAAPEGAKLIRDKAGQMVLAWSDLRGHRKQSSAKEVWNLADLGLHGFRILRQPA